MGTLRAAALGLLGATWVGLLGVAMTAAWRLDGTPGVAGEPPSLWPADSGLVRDTTRATLLMIAHPQCSCTMASLDELDWLTTRMGDTVDARVLFVEPDGAPEGWTDTRTVARARSLRGVDVIIDHGAIEARRFGIATSGDTVLYDAAGLLSYSGGITGARGHAGDNLGRRSVLGQVVGAPDAAQAASVFGCELGVETP